jgi:hypothetical protein
VMHLEDVLLDLISKYFRPILNEINLTTTIWEF